MRIVSHSNQWKKVCLGIRGSLHNANLSAPLLRLAMVENLDIFFYKYKTFDLVGIDVNLDHKFV